LNTIDAPLRLSFSVAIRLGRRFPFQSKDVLSSVSMRSPLGR
jgi:hypothetical protein